jgi:hypothetical protein
MSGSPVFRFKEDPIHTLIKDTLSKKPINSDHFSLIKRIKISDYASDSISGENLETVVKRSKEYMNQVGFAYGRLQEKGWVSDQVKDGKLRIHAPGPAIRSKFNEEDEEKLEITDSFKTKKLVGFQKVKNPESLKKKPPVLTPKRVMTTRPTTRLSASQRQAREYLNYLNALSNNEQEFIGNQVSQKRKELTQRHETEAHRMEKELNEKGIFSPLFNKERVASMLPVKMLSQNKVCIDPMIRNAKDIIMKEKLKEWQLESFDFKKNKSENIERLPRKEKLIDVVSAAITKKHVKNKKVVIQSPQKKVKMHWVDRLNQTVDDIMSKTRPDEKILNMPVIKSE